MLYLFQDVIQQAGGQVNMETGEAWHIGANVPRYHPDWTHEREVEWASLCSALMRRDIIEQVGYFDERYNPYYMEDVDLCVAVRTLGYKVVYCPKSEVYHVGGISFKAMPNLITSETKRLTGDDSLDFNSLWARNRRLFVEKWKGKSIPDK